MILVILGFLLIFFPLKLDLKYLLFTYPSNNFFLWTQRFFVLHSTSSAYTTHTIQHTFMLLFLIPESAWHTASTLPDQERDLCFSHVCTIIALHKGWYRQYNYQKKQKLGVMMKCTLLNYLYFQLEAFADLKEDRHALAQEMNIKGRIFNRYL